MSSNKNNRSQRLSPVQLVVAAIALLLIAGYEFLNPGNNPPASIPVNAPPTETAMLATRPATATDNRPPTRTPSKKVTATASAEAANNSAVTGSLPTPSKPFDYYVLSLSWSPDYCATSGYDDPQQCSIGRRLGFVLHGLWPQNTQGYPSNCSIEKMPASVKAQYAGLYPSSSLFDHEWSKHGTCTGLSPALFLAVSKQIKDSVTIPSDYVAPEKAFSASPADLITEFSQANPTYPQDSFAVHCSGSGKYLTELYVCFTREGEPMSCGSEVQKDAQKSCRSGDFIVRNTR